MAEYATCQRCGTTVKLTGTQGKNRIGTCPNCKNKVVKEK